MLYEVYIDVFFAVNAMLDFLVICLVKKIQHYKSTNIRVVLASMAGSATLCLYLCLPIRNYLLVRLLFYGGAFLIMAVIAFPDNRKRGLIKTVLVLYGISLLVNGVYHWLSLEVACLNQLTASGITVYFIVSGVNLLYRRTLVETQHIYEVSLFYNQKEIVLKGLWDTGNRLRSPYDFRGISVIGYEVFGEFLSEPMKRCVESVFRMENCCMPVGEKVIFVPYGTVGKKRAIMPVVVIEKITIKKETETIEYRNPLIGISPNPVSADEVFQVVLTTHGD